MILIDDLGINISVKYIGDNIADCKEFISYWSDTMERHYD